MKHWINAHCFFFLYLDSMKNIFNETSPVFTTVEYCFQCFHKVWWVCFYSQLKMKGIHLQYLCVIYNDLVVHLKDTNSLTNCNWMIGAVLHIFSRLPRWLLHPGSPVLVVYILPRQHFNLHLLQTLWYP